MVELSLRLVLAVLVLALASVALAQNTDCHGTVGGKNYDLSGLAKAVPNGLGSTVDGLGQSYEYKVCGNLGAQCQWTGDTTPAMCQKDTNNNQHDCGSQKKAYWAALADGSEGFILTFEGGEDNRKAVINFKCDKNAKTGLLQFNQENPQHTYIFTCATEYACAGAAPPPNKGGGGGGISGGWIFIIILVCVVVLYLIGGVIFNKFVAKKEGVEIIPNSYFWLALPGLIKDGHVYVYRKVMHLFGRGHYEEM